MSIGAHPLDGHIPCKVFVRGFRLTAEGIRQDGIYKDYPAGFLRQKSNIQNAELAGKRVSHDWSWSDQQ